MPSSWHCANAPTGRVATRQGKVTSSGDFATDNEFAAGDTVAEWHVVHYGRLIQTLDEGSEEHTAHGGLPPCDGVERALMNPNPLTAVWLSGDISVPGELSLEPFHQRLPSARGIGCIQFASELRGKPFCRGFDELADRARSTSLVNDIGDERQEQVVSLGKYLSAASREPIQKRRSARFRYDLASAHEAQGVQRLEVLADSCPAHSKRFRQ